MVRLFARYKHEEKILAETTNCRVTKNIKIVSFGANGKKLKLSLVSLYLYLLVIVIPICTILLLANGYNLQIGQAVFYIAFLLGTVVVSCLGDSF